MVNVTIYIAYMDPMGYVVLKPASLSILKIVGRIPIKQNDMSD